MVFVVITMKRASNPEKKPNAILVTKKNGRLVEIPIEVKKVL